jgi:hypothetical protein
LAGRSRPRHADERCRKFSFGELDVRLGERLEGSVVLAGQQRVDPVLDRGAQVHERRAVSEQVSQVAQLALILTARATAITAMSRTSSLSC